MECTLYISESSIFQVLKTSNPLAISDISLIFAACKQYIRYSIMISKNVENMIPKIQQFFGSQPIKKAWLFGSCSRGEESMDSDVDILVEYDRQNSRVSLMKIAAMMLNLEDLLHRKVDMVEASRLLPFALDSVNNDKFLIYERKS